MDLKKLNKIKDSNSREQFAMKVLLFKKGVCPFTGKVYTISKNKLYIDGVEKAELSNDVSESLSKIMSLTEKGIR